MAVDWWTIAIGAVCVLILIVYLITKNLKDEKKVTKSFNDETRTEKKFKFDDEEI